MPPIAPRAQLIIDLTLAAADAAVDIVEAASANVAKVRVVIMAIVTADAEDGGAIGARGYGGNEDIATTMEMVQDVIHMLDEVAAQYGFDLMLVRRDGFGEPKQG